SIHVSGGSLYSYNNRYYLNMNNIDASIVEIIAAFLSEYGNPSILSTHVLEEYGNQIIENNAVETILKYFK
ncbi:adaptor protein MecA, partial [Neobacillus niacini]